MENENYKLIMLKEERYICNICKNISIFMKYSTKYCIYCFNEYLQKNFPVELETK